MALYYRGNLFHLAYEDDVPNRGACGGACGVPDNGQTVYDCYNQTPVSLSGSPKS